MGRTDRPESDSHSLERKKKSHKDRKKRSKSSSSRRRHEKEDHAAVSSSSDVDGPKKERRRNKKSSSRRRDDRDEYSVASSVDAYRDRKRRKKEHKKKDHKKSKRKRKEDEKIEESDPLKDRNFALVDIIYNMLEDHPEMASDLPIMLIRLANGATFDLSQMTNQGVANGLTKVFQALEPFGALKDEKGAWKWSGPMSAQRKNQELVLIRLMRAVLDDVGITMEAIELANRPILAPTNQAVQLGGERSTMKNGLALAHEVSQLLGMFPGELQTELASLCKQIIEGESVDLSGIPDTKLRGGLESLFVRCGLEKVDMDIEDGSGESDGDDRADGNVQGFGLPEGPVEDASQSLALVVRVCERGNSFNDSSIDRTGDRELNASDDDDSDEGPLPLTISRQKASIDSDAIKEQAVKRQRELRNIKLGIKPDAGDGQREEWMLVPGKFDLLKDIKAGVSLRGRTFAAKSKAEGGKKYMDPATKAELDSIMKAHEDSRGPSLLEQHREAKAGKEKKKNGKESWKWNRDKDIDAGRRVDKEALGMILGGAGRDLKSKFESGL